MVRGLAAAGLILLFLLGVLFILAGFFSDFSGQHRVYPVAIGLGVVCMVGAVVGFARLLRRPRSR